MQALNNPFNTLKILKGTHYHYYSIPTLEENIKSPINRLPISLRIMLESVLRNCDDRIIKKEDIKRLANWIPKGQAGDVPFVVARVILQDFTGVPLVVDLAAMRDAVASRGYPAENINPQVPVDLVIDHSVQVDRAGTQDAFEYNLKFEFERNFERYSFLKWGQNAFKMFQVFPPGIGIVHQVNLEYLSKVVNNKEENGINVLYPDTLVGTDSHTTMVNGLGVLGWGVGGIEAEAAMLGQPVFLQLPEVIGVHLSGALQEGVTATDLTLRITEVLREEKVVGKFVEFFGEGAQQLTVADRATISNMAPEYGATVGFFPIDEQTLKYLKMTGRSEEQIEIIKKYFTAQGMFGIPKKGEIDFTKVLELDLNSIRPCVSGPKRPQDRINISQLKTKFKELLSVSTGDGGYGKPADEIPPKICVHSKGSFSLEQAHITGGESDFGNNAQNLSWSESEMVTNRPFTKALVDPGYIKQTNPAFDILLTHGTVVIAAITSCTNTSNPNVMIAAGLVAKKAVQKGLKVNPKVKTSLAPGSRVVTDYLENAGLQEYLNQLGFELVAYGCTTCIGNSGPLEESIESAIKEHDLIAASVLSGNRNFEARIHGAVKANFLMSPPLVVAFALAGRIDIDLDKEPLGYDLNQEPVFLRDIWPSTQEILETIFQSLKPEMFKKRYENMLADSPVWNEIQAKSQAEYEWDLNSTYIQKPPYFEGFEMEIPDHMELKDMRPLALFGDSVTTDHISPAGSFHADSPAGQYLLSLGIKESDFNSYGSRRGNHNVMMRGTFANIRLRNKMAGQKEGGYTKLMPENTLMAIFDASQIYLRRKTPLIVFAGKDYGMGSSRDWAAKGTALLGVKVVVARSFERIHRSNLIGMGVLPLQFKNDESFESLNLDGSETFSLIDVGSKIEPHQEFTLEILKNGNRIKIKLEAMLDTLSEVEYYRHGGILPFILRQRLSSIEKK
jgi:aconitate hydratase